MSSAAEEYWRDFCRSNPEIGLETPHQVWHFGDDRDSANSLYQLVLDRRKRATARLADESDPYPPAVGQISVVTDFDGDPKCIVRLTEVRTLPFNEVGAEFAYDEGEGDRSLNYWKEEHWRFFSRCCAELGRNPEEGMLVICQRFELLYPSAGGVN